MKAACAWVVDVGLALWLVGVVVLECFLASANEGGWDDWNDERGKGE